MKLPLSAFVAFAFLLPAVASAQMPMEGHGHDGMMMSASPSAPGTTGTVNTVDAAKHTVNLTHGPIPALGWPGMTMDFGTAPSIDLSKLKPGDAVAFTVSKTPGGGYLIDTLKPAE